MKVNKSLLFECLFAGSHTDAVLALQHVNSSYILSREIPIPLPDPLLSKVIYSRTMLNPYCKLSRAFAKATAEAVIKIKFPRYLVSLFIPYFYLIVYALRHLIVTYRSIGINFLSLSNRTA